MGLENKNWVFTTHPIVQWLSSTDCILIRLKLIALVNAQFFHTLPKLGYPALSSQISFQFNGNLHMKILPSKQLC
jgi:hypothetical protein